MDSGRLIKISFFVLLIFFCLSEIAWGGFGISPPYFVNKNLARGSHYESKIILVRDDPVEDWKAEIEVQVTGAESWFSIDKGRSFILPKGEKQIPIIVKIDIPKEAPFGSYEGFLRVRVSPVGPPEGGTVAIALGGRIEVDLKVGEQEIFDFKVWGVKIRDTEEGHRSWWFYLPGKIRFLMKIENTGNFKAGPTKVQFDIYNEKETELLESIETENIEKIEPFETKEITANLLTKLGPGNYWVKFKIFKGEEVAQNGEGKLNLNIVPYGTIPGYKDADFFDLTVKEQLPVFIGAFIILVLIVFILVKIILFIIKIRRDRKIKKFEESEKTEEFERPAEIIEERIEKKECIKEEAEKVNEIKRSKKQMREGKKIKKKKKIRVSKKNKKAKKSKP